MKVCSVVAALGVLLAVASCSRRELSGPPDIRLGRVECGECGMIITEERSACALLIERGDRREHVVFDDIGCMIDFELEGHADFTVIDRFVHDRASREWLSAANASFVFSEGAIKTPMGSGIAACRTKPSAEQLQKDTGGEIVVYAGLCEMRRARIEARRGTPDPKP